MAINLWVDYSTYVCLMGLVGDAQPPLWERLGGIRGAACLVVAYKSGSRGMVGMQVGCWGNGPLGQLDLLGLQQLWMYWGIVGGVFGVGVEGECCIYF